MNKPAIVILHGWGLSKERFLPLADALKKRGYSVFVPDFPGFGSSDAPDKPLKLADYAQFLHDYLERNRLEHPVLIGHSFGGRVSIKYETMYPKSVRAIILSGTPGFTQVKRIKRILTSFIAKIGNALLSIPPFFLLKDSVRRYFYYLFGAREYYQAQGAMRQTFKNIVQEQLPTIMRSIKVPCALIWGANDAMVPVAIAKQMAAIIPGATLWIVNDADHGVPYKQPEVFADYVEKFLKTI